MEERSGVGAFRYSDIKLEEHYGIQAEQEHSGGGAFR